MPILSSTAEYALRAVLHLGRRHGPASVAALARELDIPRNYLSKTLAVLARAGVLTSARGRHGGFGLARPEHRITLDDVVAPFEPMGQRHCLLGNRVCHDRTACEAHASWGVVADRMASYFRTTTVADILKNDHRDRPASGRLERPRLRQRGA